MSSAPLLHYTARWGNPTSLQILLDHGADIHKEDSKGKTALFKSENKKNTQFLVEKEANVNATDKKGNTPLHYYMKRTDGSRHAKILLLHGAVINACNKKGRTPLHIAAKCAAIKEMQLLLKHNADKSIQDKKGKTPLNILKKVDIEDFPKKHKAILLLDPEAELPGEDTVISKETVNSYSLILKAVPQFLQKHSSLELDTMVTITVLDGAIIITKND